MILIGQVMENDGTTQNECPWKHWWDVRNVTMILIGQEMENDGNTQNGCPWKHCWDAGHKDVKSFDLSQGDAGLGTNEEAKSVLLRCVCMHVHVIIQKVCG